MSDKFAERLDITVVYDGIPGDILGTGSGPIETDLYRRRCSLGRAITSKRSNVSMHVFYWRWGQSKQ